MKTVEPFFHGLRVDPEAIMRRSLIGSAQECVEQIERFVEVGCDKFVLRPICPPADIPSQLEHYGQDILPHFV